MTLKSILPSLFIAFAATAMGQQVDRLGLTDMNITRSDSASLRVSMTVKPSLCHLKRDQLMKVVPVLRSSDREFELELTPYAIAGKNQYYYTIREDQYKGELFRSGSSVTEQYAVNVAWQPWMADAVLDFDVTTSACCGAPVSDEEIPVAELNYMPPTVTADLDYIEPIAVETKEYALEGRAYVNFPVNRTEIFPDYLNNPIELKKIINSIDTVRDNKDATIQSITLTGYASPEGPYLNNVRLAKGRTEAVKEYVRKQYDFPASVFISSSVPEDWVGLRESIEKSNLPMRDKMLGFIDSDYPIETRNDKFRATFPTDYEWLLKNVYPWLRHTDYLIKYTIRKYTDVNEIKEIIKTRPQNLSLDEFYLAAQSYPVGSKEYDEVFDIAVLMYPDEPVANLNAANSAIRRGDYERAEKLLDRAGDNDDAKYAKGMLYAKMGDYDKALGFLYKCNSPKADAAIKQINEIKDHKGGVNFIQH